VGTLFEIALSTERLSIIYERQPTLAEWDDVVHMEVCTQVLTTPRAPALLPIPHQRSLARGE
jgi:hypothetical protein